VNLFRPLPGGPTIAGLGVFGGAAMAGLTLWRVLTLEALPAPTPPAVELERTSAAPRLPYSFEQVLAAVDRDPFQPARRRPALKFQLPEEVAARLASGVAADRPAGIRVIGTAVLPDGGFALCQRAGGSPMLVRLGGTLGDLTLKAVDPGTATFLTASGATLIVHVVKPGGGN